MGKGAIDESLPNYRGVYAGAISLEEVSKEIKNADLLIEVGSIKSDFNTGSFTYGLENTKTISLNGSFTTILHAEYSGVRMQDVLPVLTKEFSKDRKPRAKSAPIDNGTDAITHNYLWNKVPEYIAENGIIVSETRTSEFGVFNMESPKGATFISQILWGSIGFSISAAVGAAMADRSRKGLTPVIFLLNNVGYLMEKLIHSPERSYNNFQMWKYSQTLDYFGGNLEINKTEGKNPSPIGVEAKVNTRQEFESPMEKISEEPDKIHFLEAIMPRFDSPRELLLLCDLFENR